ncbi:hypothetical protein [Actinoplanes xinjiangensis]|jgi:hypothetical protein|uniref:Uncharacterized protein n=1 Tax=Actinoplanes xinjiangensis TaxID=512350 RepID=A0A316FS59_9ACTN|nr:hypothetical protein [Actinoplanes xinjiangensis]PWK51489.1 hypothetical protein BC793_102519 [Actinoplanes xinjiangensis]GIF35848.1 hypothetical protein Axi01nite_01590 [Actinoplanes xinjiangensis]
MTTPGDIALLIVLAAALMACAGYAAGRFHQRRQSGPDLRDAYKTGYDAATRSVFSMAARAAGRKPDSPDADTDTDPDAPDAPDVPGQREGRHAVPEELVRAKTYRLPVDRVARAKVPRQVESADDPAPSEVNTSP